MKKALVIGASGSIGYAIVFELIRRGMKVVAFARNEEKLRSLFAEEKNVTIQKGDAGNEQNLEQAAKGVDIIFHSLNVPYQTWDQYLVNYLNNILSVAKKFHTKLAYVDNVYAYGIPAESPITEETRKEPHTKKGKIRLELEKLLLESHVDTLLVHMPDVYGPNASGTLLHETLKNVVKGKSTIYVGNLKTKREYLYTKDGAKAMVELALQEDTYNQVWNIPSTHPITGEEMIDLLKKAYTYQKRMIPIPKSVIRLMGLFSPLMRELVEMMYITETPIILSGRKYEQRIGELPKTPYHIGIVETLEWIKEHER